MLRTYLEVSKGKEGEQALGEMSSLQLVFWFSNHGGGDKKHMEVRGGGTVPGGLEAEAGLAACRHRTDSERRLQRG